MYASLTSEPRGRSVPSVAERRRRNRQEMLDGILATARAQMREEGVAALNLNEVARRIGVTTPALYKYFPSKMALYDALFRLGTRLYLEEFKALNLGEFPSGGTAIRAALEHQLSFSTRHPELYQLVLQRPVPGFVPSDEALAEAAQAEKVAVATVSRWIERGLIAPTVPPERAFAVLAVLAEGIASAHIANEPDVPIGEGRFGSLVLDAANLIELAWKPVRRKPNVRRGAHRRVRGKREKKEAAGK
jgi:AcrR family transcriptional regulator